jgi:hypothetical protein
MIHIHDLRLQVHQPLAGEDPDRSPPRQPPRKSRQPRSLPPSRQGVRFPPSMETASACLTGDSQQTQKPGHHGYTTPSPHAGSATKLNRNSRICKPSRVKGVEQPTNQPKTVRPTVHWSLRIHAAGMAIGKSFRWSGRLYTTTRYRYMPLAGARGVPVTHGRPTHRRLRPSTATQTPCDDTSKLVTGLKPRR